MSYGCQIWGQNQLSSKFKKIVNLQKRAMRIMSFSNYDSASKPLFKQFKILKLQDQIALNNCLLIYMITHVTTFLTASRTSFNLVLTCTTLTPGLVLAQSLFHTIAQQHTVGNQ